MTQTEIQELARTIIGDGKDPNKFFVTASPNIIVDSNESDDSEYELLEGFSDSDITTTVFDSYEDAYEFYDSIDLDPHAGVGEVIIEDRKTGVITSKYLQKRMIIDYNMIEHDDAKLFGYTK